AEAATGDHSGADRDLSPPGRGEALERKLRRLLEARAPGWLLGRRARRWKRSRLWKSAGLSLRLGLVRWNFTRECLERGFAGEQTRELIPVDRLSLDQDLRNPMQIVDVLAEDVQRQFMAVVDDPPDLIVDFRRKLIRVVRFVPDREPEEG